MTHKDYLALMDKLREPKHAAAYLAAFLDQKGHAAFLAALKDVADAQGGMTELARRAGARRQTLYRVLAETGNPTIDTLQRVLRVLGLRLAIAPRPQTPARRKKSRR